MTDFDECGRYENGKTWLFFANLEAEGEELYSMSVNTNETNSIFYNLCKCEMVNFNHIKVVYLLLSFEISTTFY